jgi:hypothetical protein
MVPVWFGQARISAVFGDEDQTPITTDPAGVRIRVVLHPRGLLQGWLRSDVRARPVDGADEAPTG